MHGLLLIHKEAGVTSHDVVAGVRRLLKQKSVGHAGTLDPMATGLLLILVGHGTKFSDAFRGGVKTYELVVEFGVETDSLDATGEVVKKSDTKSLTEAQVLSYAEALQGTFDWPIPLFSAKKVKGQPLYKMAHQGKELKVLPTKPMTFFDLSHLNYDAETCRLKAQISCEKGGFIRTWAQQLGERLGVGAHLSSLKRIGSGGYRLDQSVSLEKLQNLKAEHEKLELSVLPEGCFHSIKKLMPEWPSVTVIGKDLRLLRNGQVSYDLDRRLTGVQKQSFKSGRSTGVKVFNPQQELLSLLEVRKGKGVRVKRTFSHKG